MRFGYEGTARPVLDGFDLRVAPGEMVALVGASGSGKSTAALLLPRFYDVSAGPVTIDGIDVRDVTLRLAARRRSAWCSRSRSCSPTSVRANIAYGRPDATDAEVEAAAGRRPGRRVHPPRCPTATTPWWASGA